MKIVEFNTVPYGSTGRIAQNISKVAANAGHDVYFVCGWTKGRRKSLDDHNIVATGFLSKLYHLFLSKVFGLDGFGSYFATKRLVKKLNHIKPDIIHFHIMHDGFLHLPTLTEFIKQKHIPVIWTFHDCWTFTGGCPHFVLNQCYKWKNGCKNCSYWKGYSLIKNNSSEKQCKFKSYFSKEINNLTIVTPSKWLSELVGQSMFLNHSRLVINNGIDLSVFLPQNSNFKEKNHCTGKYIVLGVAFDWGERKGLDVFIELSTILSDQYQIVLVGTNKKIEKSLPDNIISIQKTKDQSGLAEIYSAADVFVNPTREEVFGMVNTEALACGTPVITFNTGGSPESISNTCGIVVNEKNAYSLKNAIIKVCENRLIDRKNCRKKALEFEEYEKYTQYLELFSKIKRKD